MNTKSERREQARHKSRYGMQVKGRSVKLLMSLVMKKAGAK